MTSHDLTIAGYLTLLAAGVALQVTASRRPDGQLPPLQNVLARAMRTRTSRLALIVGWGWVGLHFFAR